MRLSDARAWFVADRRLFAAALVAAFAGTALMAAPVSGGVHRAYVATLVKTDFRAFYCAGRLVIRRENPYLAAPLAACERTEAVVDGVPSTEVIDPAPLPAYGFYLVAPLAALPFDAAAAVWTLLSLVACAGGAWLMARLARLPFAVTLSAVAVNEGYLTITYGQISPLIVFALATSAFWLERGRFAAAGGAAAACMIEPHMGLPACLSLFVWVPRTRLALAALGLICAALMFGSGGAAGVRSYFTQTLPVHQLSEVGEPIQYSLTWILHSFGAADGIALRLGSLDYALMLLAGVLLAGRLRTAFSSPAPLVLFPPALAMLGGPFVHIFEIAGAMPFALFAAGRAPAHRALAWASVALLALNWPAFHFVRLNVLETIVIGTLAGFLTIGRNLAMRAGIALAAVAVYFAIPYGVSALPARPLLEPNTIAASSLAPYDPSLASTRDAYSRPSDQHWDTVSLQTVAGKLPTWFGLLLLFAFGLTSRTRRIDPA